MSVARWSVSLLLVVALGFAAGAARAETENCTPVVSLPAVINTEGLYCLTGDLSTAMTSGTAIAIETNDVVLDLNGYKLGGLAAGAGTETLGVRAFNRQNVTIRNGTIRGFKQAIVIDNSGSSQGHLVEQIRADQNFYIGITVQGAGSIVRNNQIVTIGGSTTFGVNANAYGIAVLGDGPRVINNNIVEITAQGSGTSWGIFVGAGTGGLVVDNRISDADTGVDFTTGAFGKYRGNVTLAVTTPFTGGTDAGNNN